MTQRKPSSRRFCSYLADTRKTAGQNPVSGKELKRYSAEASWQKKPKAKSRGLRTWETAQCTYVQLTGAPTSTHQLCADAEAVRPWTCYIASVPIQGRLEAHGKVTRQQPRKNFKFKVRGHSIDEDVDCLFRLRPCGDSCSLALFCPASSSDDLQLLQALLF